MMSYLPDLGERYRWTKEPFLTIGMATANDFYGVQSTITSLLFHHAEARDHLEFIVVDNRPNTEEGKLTKKWIEGRTPARYISFPGNEGTAQPRNEVFRQARGKFTLCCDSHILLAPDSLSRLIAFLKENEDSTNLYSGPLVTDSNTRLMGTHQRPEWGTNALGIWSVDNRGLIADNPPFEIYQQGMGLFVSSTEHWPKFHPDFRGFGGCETYIMEKIRQRGDKVICLPFLRWTHRFQKLERQKNPGDILDIVRNYLIGWRELGKDTQEIHDNFGTSKAFEEEIINGDYEELEEAVIKGRKTRYPIIPKAFSGPEKSDRSIAVVGSESGPMKMRGRPLAERLGADLYTEELPSKKYDVVIAVKEDRPEVRELAELLIADPNDIFYKLSNEYRRPADYWIYYHQLLKADIYIATSPACKEMMVEALPSHPIYIIPHSSDPRIRSDWYNPDGPIAYAGQTCFIKSRLKHLEEAASFLGKKFIYGLSYETLRGASLAFIGRCCPYTNRLFSNCKPQVKMENAIAAGIPFLHSKERAGLTLRPDIPYVVGCSEANQFAQGFLEALNQPLQTDPYTLDRYLEDMENLTNGIINRYSWTS